MLENQQLLIGNWRSCRRIWVAVSVFLRTAKLGKNLARISTIPRLVRDSFACRPCGVVVNRNQGRVPTQQHAEGLVLAL